MKNQDIICVIFGYLLSVSFAIPGYATIPPVPEELEMGACPTRLFAGSEASGYVCMDPLLRHGRTLLGAEVFVRQGSSVPTLPEPMDEDITRALESTMEVLRSIPAATSLRSGDTEEPIYAVPRTMKGRPFQNPWNWGVSRLSTLGGYLSVKQPSESDSVFSENAYNLIAPDVNLLERQQDITTPTSPYHGYGVKALVCATSVAFLGGGVTALGLATGLALMYPKAFLAFLPLGAQLQTNLTTAHTALEWAHHNLTNHQATISALGRQIHKAQTQSALNNRSCHEIIEGFRTNISDLKTTHEEKILNLTVSINETVRIHNDENLIHLNAYNQSKREIADCLTKTANLQNLLDNCQAKYDACSQDNIALGKAHQRSSDRLDRCKSKTENQQPPTRSTLSKKISNRTK